MKLNRNGLFIFSMLTVSMLTFLLLPVIGYEYLLVTLAVYFMTTCIGGTITYHRLLSHKSFKAPTWFRWLGLACGIWGIYGSPLAWAAIHRDHHRHTDTPEDPHSPLFKKWWQVQFLSSLEKVNLRMVPDLRKDKLIVFLHRNYLKIHLLIIVSLLLIQPAALLYAYLWPAFLTWNLASLVNTLNHQMGYRNFETRDNSHNLWPLGLLVFGEGWHNNHHANPRKYSFSHHWWEIDIGAGIIKAVKLR